MGYASPAKYACDSCKDRFVTLPPGSASFKGPMIEALDLVEKKSLLDPKLWSVFVDQFRIANVDDFDYGWRGEYWGKMVRGACITYEYDKNEELYRNLERTVRDILTTQDRFGRIATYSVTNEFHGWDVWCRKYVMLGLEYFLEICRDEALAGEIVGALRKQADYLDAKIGFNEVGKLNVTVTSEAWEGLNASSVLEPVARLYNLTGDSKYLDFAQKIVAAGGGRSFNLFEEALRGEKAPYQLPVTKAYEMISNFEGILELYRATGFEDYRTMALNFADLVLKTDITVIGCAGTTHELFDHSAVRQFDPEFNKSIVQETCVTVTWMKFCFRLLALTGNAKFADAVETSAYNALLGAVNFRGNPYNGEVFAFDSYSPLLDSKRGLAVGGYKTLCGGLMHWGCCVAIGAAGTGLFPRNAVLKTLDGNCFAVNFYMPGTVALDADTSLDIKTDYPYDAKVKITVKCGKDDSVRLILRVPAWSKKTVIKVNGERCGYSLEKGFAAVEREFKDGDCIDVKLDLRVRIVRATDIDPEVAGEAGDHISLLRGPLALARDEAFSHDLNESAAFPEKEKYAKEAFVRRGSLPRLAVGIETADGIFETADYASCGYNWERRMTAWIKSR